MYHQESHCLVNLKTCHAQDIYEGCDSRTSSFRILIFSLDGRMVSFFWHSESGREKRPEAARPQSSAASKSRCRTWPKWNNLMYLRHEDPIDPIELKFESLHAALLVAWSVVFVPACEPASYMTSMASARAGSSSRFVDVSRCLKASASYWDSLGKD